MYNDESSAWRLYKQSLRVGIPKLELGNQTTKSEVAVPFRFTTVCRQYAIALDPDSASAGLDRKEALHAEA